jgi:hypothetical protein
MRKARQITVVGSTRIIWEYASDSESTEQFLKSSQAFFRMMEEESERNHKLRHPDKPTVVPSRLHEADQPGNLLAQQRMADISEFELLPSPRTVLVNPITDDETFEVGDVVDFSDLLTEEEKKHFFHPANKENQ